MMPDAPITNDELAALRLLTVANVQTVDGRATVILPADLVRAALDELAERREFEWWDDRQTPEDEPTEGGT